jgi:hypothetical protein
MEGPKLDLAALEMMVKQVVDYRPKKRTPKPKPTQSAKSTV